MINIIDNNKPELVEKQIRNYFYNLSNINKQSTQVVDNCDSLNLLFNKYIKTQVLKFIINNYKIIIIIVLGTFLLYIRYKDKQHKDNIRKQLYMVNF